MVELQTCRCLLQAAGHKAIRPIRHANTCLISFEILIFYLVVVAGMGCVCCVCCVFVVENLSFVVDWITCVHSWHSLCMMCMDVHRDVVGESKGEEEKRVLYELGHIRSKFTKAKINAYNRKKYMWKLLYIYLLGYDVDAGTIITHQLQSITSRVYTEKLVVREFS